MRFSGMLETLTFADVQSILTDAERVSVKSMKTYLDGLLKRWDSNNTESKRVWLSRNMS